MGGLAAALACGRAGWQPRIFEQATQFSEVGAGIQLGPNATRILAGWGLAQALSEVAAFPQQLRVRSAHDGAQLGVLRLGEAVEERYGAPYATVHRADLQAVLVEAVRAAGFQPTALIQGDRGAARVRGRDGGDRRRRRSRRRRAHPCDGRRPHRRRRPVEQRARTRVGRRAAADLQATWPIAAWSRRPTCRRGCVRTT